MNYGEVVLFIGPIRHDRNYVVDVQLTLMKDQVNDVITDKATTGLTVQKSSLKTYPFLLA